MTKEEYKEIFERLANEPEMINFLFISLVCSDTILTEEEANWAMAELYEIKAALEMKDIAIEQKKKKFWLKLAKQGIKICQNDIARFSKKHTRNQEGIVNNKEEENVTN